MSLRIQNQGLTREELIQLLSNETQFELAGPHDYHGGANEQVDTVAASNTSHVITNDGKEVV
jgi:hypothetical protein